MAILNDQLIRDIQAGYAAIWACNSNADLQPDLVRLMGVKVEPDRAHLTLFLPIPRSREMIENFALTHKMAFLFALLGNNASYQLKGRYISHRPCTADEVEFQRLYLLEFGKILDRERLPGQNGFRAYFQQPGIAVRMQVAEVYEQTPKTGAGERVF